MIPFSRFISAWRIRFASGRRPQDSTCNSTPDITRNLTLSVLQFLTAEQIADLLEVTVTLIDKPLSLGLQWAEIGLLFRLPGYASIAEAVGAAATVEARVFEIDIILLRGPGSSLARSLETLGFIVFGFTAERQRQWDFLESRGVAGIYVDDLTLRSRPPVPNPAR